MKRNVLLITNYGNDLTKAAAKTDSPRESFDILRLALHDVDLAIVDIGANMQSIAMIETLSHAQHAPPVIALVNEKDSDLVPEFYEHGAAACMVKPFCADELARLIEAVCASAPEKNSPSCDKWGHLAGSNGAKTLRNLAAASRR